MVISLAIITIKITNENNTKTHKPWPQRVQTLSELNNTLFYAKIL